MPVGSVRYPKRVPNLIYLALVGIDLVQVDIDEAKFEHGLRGHGWHSRRGRVCDVNGGAIGTMLREGDNRVVEGSHGVDVYF